MTMSKERIDFYDDSEMGRMPVDYSRRGQGLYIGAV
jgi:hypothetical protein